MKKIRIRFLVIGIIMGGVSLIFPFSPLSSQEAIELGKSKLDIAPKEAPIVKEAGKKVALPEDLKEEELLDPRQRIQAEDINAQFKRFRETGKLPDGRLSSEFIPTQALSMVEGVAETLKLPIVPGNIELSNKTVVDPSIEWDEKANTIRLVPKAQGSVSLTVFDEKGIPQIRYYIDVSREDPRKTISQMKLLIGKVEGINFKVVSGKIIIDGEVILISELERVMQAAALFSENTVMMVSLSPITLRKVAKKIEQESKDTLPGADITTRVMNKSLVIEGTVDSKITFDGLKKIVAAYYPGTVKAKAGSKDLNVRVPKLETVIYLVQQIKRKTGVGGPAPVPKMIKIIVHYVETAKDFDKTFDFAWAPGISTNQNSKIEADLNTGKVTTFLVGTLSNLFPTIDNIVTHGAGRILKAVEIIVKNNTKGSQIDNSFNIPFRTGVDQAGNATFTMQPVKTRLKVGAKILPGTAPPEIDLNTQFTVSEVISTVQGAPQSISNSISSNIIVRHNHSAALGGLMTNDFNGSYNRPTPRTQAISENAVDARILDLKKSRVYKYVHEQFVIFITPIILPFAHKGVDEIKRKFRIGANHFISTKG